MKGDVAVAGLGECQNLRAAHGVLDEVDAGVSLGYPA
jgi:hypothetical protein